MNRLAIATVVALLAGCALIEHLPDDWPDIDLPSTPTTTPTTTTTTQPPVTPPTPEPGQEPDAAPNAEALHPPVYSTNGAQFVKWDGSGGWKYNADNSRHRAKLICKGSLAGKIAGVYCFSPDGTFTEKLGRATPDEYGNRQRYYGKTKIDKLPSPLLFRVDCNDGSGVARDYCLRVPNAQKTSD